jgi:hypothetical protein
MDIVRAPLPVVQASIGKRRILIESDVFNIVEQLQEISPTLSVNFIDQGENGWYSIVETTPDGREHHVTTVLELTPAVVEHVKMLGSESYDAVAEMEKMDDQAALDKKRRFAERIGEVGERLHHALRKDYNVKDRIWVPGMPK